MCQFFSLISDGRGKVRYFNHKLRTKIKHQKLRDKSGNLYENPDSHTTICSYFNQLEDYCNKWEYNPITGKLTKDRILMTDDYALVLNFCKQLDFTTVIPELNLHPIVNPFKDVKKHEVTKLDIANLKKWAEIQDSVSYSVHNSVYDSICNSVPYSVRDSVQYSVWNSVYGVIEDSVYGVIGDSIKDIIEDSIKDIIRAYISSFFDLKKWVGIDHLEGENPFQPCINLWNRGLIPSFDGKTWKLHQGPGAKVVYERIK